MSYSDIHSSYLGDYNNGTFGLTGTYDHTLTKECRLFQDGCILHHIDVIQKYIHNMTKSYIISGLRLVFVYFNSPTCINVLQFLIQYDSSLSIEVLKILSNIQGLCNYYRDIFVLALLNTSPEQINNSRLLISPGNIRKFNVEQLLMFGGDVNISSTNGVTPLMMGCRYGTPEIVQFLLTSGAKVHTENYYGATSNHYADKNYEHCEPIKHILSIHIF